MGMQMKWRFINVNECDECKKRTDSVAYFDEIVQCTVYMVHPFTSIKFYAVLSCRLIRYLRLCDSVEFIFSALHCERLLFSLALCWKPSSSSSSEMIFALTSIWNEQSKNCCVFARAQRDEILSKWRVKLHEALTNRKSSHTHTCTLTPSCEKQRLYSTTI